MLTDLKKQKKLIKKINLKKKKTNLNMSIVWVFFPVFPLTLGFEFTPE